MILKFSKPGVKVVTRLEDPTNAFSMLTFKYLKAVSVTTSDGFVLFWNEGDNNAAGAILAEHIVAIEAITQEQEQDS